MYNLGDSTWRNQPKVMSHETIDALIARVAQHCKKHSHHTFTFGFHGGEPLLMPDESLSYFVKTARAALKPNTLPRFQVQTNGTLLTLSKCEFLGELGVDIGVSLDGPRAINDLHRLDHNGNGSYDAVRLGLDNVKRAGLSFGILTVIDPTIDPVLVYEHLVELGPRSVDLLLPEATHDKPPAHLPTVDNTSSSLYGDWLLRFFECWSTGDVAPFRVRRFDLIIETVLGLRPPLDHVDAHRNEVLVIETDGGIEPVDVLKVCRPGITSTEMNVHSHSLDSAFQNELIALYYASYDSLCEVCTTCSIRSICGGGYLPHRFSESNGFDNPSVYCQDQWALIRGIQRWTLKQLPSELVNHTGVTPIE